MHTGRKFKLTARTENARTGKPLKAFALDLTLYANEDCSVIYVRDENGAENSYPLGPEMVGIEIQAEVERLIVEHLTKAL